MYLLQKCLKHFHRIVCQNKSAKIYSETILTMCNVVYFRLCINPMHITPPVTAEGFDGSHHPRYAECFERLVCLKIESNIDVKSGQSLRIVYQCIDKYFGPAVLQQFLFHFKRTGIFILRHKLATCVIRGSGIFFISAN